MKSFNLSKPAGKFITSLPPKQFKQVLSKTLALAANPLPSDSAKLKGFDNLYRADIGEYRIVYSFNEELVFIKEIGKRNDDDVYKKLKK